ncbi:electron transfer flavoprotein subunit alpha/FixB family protein [Thermodesulfobacteriota bacterium]
MEVFTIAEHSEGELASVSFELLNLANLIKGDGKSNAIILGKNAGKLGAPLAEYADKVWAVEDEAFENYNPELYMDIIHQILGENKPALVLFGDTPFGKETAPCLAVKLNAPVQTDVISVEVSDEVSISKYACQGKVVIDMGLRKSECYVLTVRQNVFKDGPQVTGDIELVSIKPSIVPRRDFVKYIDPEAGEVDISKEDVVVTVGRGIGDSSKMSIAEDLAKLLGGVTAGTRPVVDNGWLSKDRQVGQSGKVISPKFYFGLGVSGASQHVAGMKDSGLIIAINKDPDAPIFGVAEYCVSGDVHEIIPELINQIRKIKE